MRTMARRRAQKRWSALLTRIQNHVRLNDRLWSNFVAYAKENYYEAFLAAFKGPALHCVGPVGGSPCGFVVDLTSPDASHTLELLHIDHEQDVVVTCDLWMRALPVHPVSWDDGVSGSLLCHLLFGVAPCSTHGREMLCFRCRPDASRCHNLTLPHYEVVHSVALVP